MPVLLSSQCGMPRQATHSRRHARAVWLASCIDTRIRHNLQLPIARDKLL